MHEKIMTETPMATYRPIFVALGVLGDMRGEAVAEWANEASVRSTRQVIEDASGMRLSWCLHRGGIAVD
jgi:hypothetical protein